MEEESLRLRQECLPFRYIESQEQSGLDLTALGDLYGRLSKYGQLWDLEPFTGILWVVKIVGLPVSSFSSIYPLQNTFWYNPTAQIITPTELFPIIPRG